MTDLRKCVLNRRPRNPIVGRRELDFSPLDPMSYFDAEEEIESERGRFHIYKKGDVGPILFCLHGAGYSGLTWALFAVNICSNIECQVVSIDLRGHGLTSTSQDDDLAISTLSEDVAAVVTQLSSGNTPIILIGHSMGGAVATHAAHLANCVVGLCVIDVVEGTALEALSSMQNVLRGRPTGFVDVEHAISWCFKSGQTKNLEAAKISMQGQIVKADSISLTHSGDNFTIPEVDDQEDKSKGDFLAKPPQPTKVARVTSGESSTSIAYKWRIDLRKTEPYWRCWFEGLSQKFLQLQIPKILMIANINGLDTALTVGQMQGKFQFHVLPKSGHAIHEDQPHRVAEVISTYLVKHKLANPREGFEVPIPKVFAAKSIV